MLQTAQTQRVLDNQSIIGRERVEEEDKIWVVYIPYPGLVHLTIYANNIYPR